MTHDGTKPEAAAARRLFRLYYGATALFLVLDYAFGLNVRIAFLDGFPAARLGYYLFCFACLALILWRPALTMIVAAVESLVTLAALITGFGIRVLLPVMPDGDVGQPVPTLAEVMNFLLSGAIAYVAWWRGMRALGDMTRS